MLEIQNERAVEERLNMLEGAVLDRFSIQRRMDVEQIHLKEQIHLLDLTIDALLERLKNIEAKLGISN